MTDRRGCGRVALGAIGLAGAFATGGALPTAGALAADGAEAPPRIEARSASFLAVGVVEHERMTLRLSRRADNAPVADATVSVELRGTGHQAVAQADGSYAFASADLAVPGAAAVRIEVRERGIDEQLAGTLQIGAAADAAEGDKNSARQLWWWVLNFGVCIGFLWLLSRRRKSVQD